MFPEVSSKPRAALETYPGVYVCSPDFARRHNCATCGLYTLHSPLDAVCCACLIDCRAPRYLCHVLQYSWHSPYLVHIFELSTTAARILRHFRALSATNKYMFRL